MNIGGRSKSALYVIPQVNTTTPLHQIASGTNHDDDCADIDDVYLHVRLDALVISAADALPRPLGHHTVVAARTASDRKNYRLKDFILTFIPQ